MKNIVKIQLDVDDKLTQTILKDTLADSKQAPQDTLTTIFDIGLSVVASHVADRCPRLQKNLEKWLDEKGELL